MNSDSTMVLPLGGEQWEGWTGIDGDGGDGVGAFLGDTGEAIFRYPDGPRGWYKHGLRMENDGVANWRHFYGLQLDLHLDGGPAQLEVYITSAQPETVTASVSLTGPGWHTLTLPWSVFAFEQARTYFLDSIKEVRLGVRAAGRVGLRRVRVVRGEALALQCAVQGRSAPQGQAAEYEVRVGNCTDETQAVTLLFERYGWEAMTSTVEPAFLTLAPGDSQVVTVRVLVSGRVPPGGHEKQILRAVPNGDGARAATLTLLTASRLPHPYLLHTPSRWQEVREKVESYAWAGEALAVYVARAEAYEVPEVAQPPDNDPDDTMGPFLFRTSNEKDLMACGIAWQLTGEKRHAEKIALFLRRLSDPANGYPVTLRGCNQGLVQEGHFFQHIAMAYDMALNAGVFSGRGPGANRGHVPPVP